MSAQDLPVMYHEVIPENNTDYAEFQQADFVLSYRGRCIELGSIRIEGELQVTDNANPLSDTPNSQVNLDPMVGAHALAEGFTTTLGAEGGGRIIENLITYPRFVKMQKVATEGNASQHNSNAVCELRASIADQTNAVLQGVVPGTQPGGSSNITLRHYPDFSFKPLIALNSARGNLPHDRAGEIRITMTCERNAAALYGTGMSANVGYVIKNLRLTFRSRPMSAATEDPITMRTKVAIKQSVASSFANIQTLVPAVCTGVSASFQPQADENALVPNNTQLSKVPNLTQTQMLFNDSTNQLVSYVIRNNSELIGRYIDSFADTGRNRMSRVRTADDDGFGIGLPFDSAVDLSSQKFSLQIQSGISSSAPLLAYMYFHSFVSL
jgi:hypothetical protein